MSSPPSRFTYSWTPAQPSGRSAGRISTSRTELLQIGVACAVLTLDFALLFSRTSIGFGSGVANFFSLQVAEFIGIGATAALTGFVAHEMAHKIVAQRRGFWAEFRWSPLGLGLSFFSVVVAGLLFAAPGATVVGGIPPSDRESWGRTALAGPLTNVGFSLAFFAASAGLFRIETALADLLLFLAFINAWFGTFNLLPLGPLDGRKVLHWGVGYWIAALVGTGAIAVVTGLGLYSFATPNPLLGL